MRMAGCSHECYCKSDDLKLFLKFPLSLSTPYQPKEDTDKPEESGDKGGEEPADKPEEGGEEQTASQPKEKS